MAKKDLSFTIAIFPLVLLLALLKLLGLNISWMLVFALLWLPIGAFIVMCIAIGIALFTVCVGLILLGIFTVIQES